MAAKNIGIFSTALVTWTCDREGMWVSNHLFVSILLPTWLHACDVFASMVGDAFKYTTSFDITNQKG
jgi:CDP-diglyceride synthetase